jgi:hypothetical protein
MSCPKRKKKAARPFARAKHRDAFGRAIPTTQYSLFGITADNNGRPALQPVAVMIAAIRQAVTSVSDMHGLRPQYSKIDQELLRSAREVIEKEVLANIPLAICPWCVERGHSEPECACHGAGWLSRIEVDQCWQALETSQFRTSPGRSGSPWRGPRARGESSAAIRRHDGRLRPAQGDVDRVLDFWVAPDGNGGDSELPEDSVSPPGDDEATH